MNKEGIVSLPGEQSQPYLSSDQAEIQAILLSTALVSQLVNTYFEPLHLSSLLTASPKPTKSRPVHITTRDGQNSLWNYLAIHLAGG